MNAVGKRCILSAILFFFICFSSFAQYRNDWRTKIDSIIDRADRLSLKSQQVFYLTKYMKNDQSFKETWYYTINDGRVLIFEIRYIIDSTEFTEKYYMNKSQLICVEQYEFPQFAYNVDQLETGGVYFFENNYLKQYTVCGNKNLRNNWGNAGDVQDKFQKRFSELQREIAAVKPSLFRE